ncbi:hypothetical protein R54876_GBNLAHCA_00714 [Eupransor demetentiae]|uniref:Uncharacterized protein n=1 Tax=Eupransor demetentiae TaxID=3109584 RepID=A0ABP0ESF5_9LACO|nr:hypothetical protein R54876_GBNLAHCA_00714 [Lactobacillaceae bacterium LMG 33000]
MMYTAGLVFFIFIFTGLALHKLGVHEDYLFQLKNQLNRVERKFNDDRSHFNRSSNSNTSNRNRK